MEGFLEKGEQAVCLLEQSGYEELREQAMAGRHSLSRGI